MKRALAARALERTGAGAVMRRAGRWRGVLVLTYHRVGDGWSDDRWDSEVWSASAERLDSQFRALARGAEVVPVDSIPDAVRAPRGRRVAITFDDGYRDNHDVALSLLRAHGLAATFFIATGFIDRPRPPWWDEVAWIVRRAERDRIAAVEPLGTALAWPTAADRERAIADLIAAGKQLPDDALPGFLDSLSQAAGSPRCDPRLWSERWMTWDMVRNLRDAGMSIGGHTIDHPVLARLPAQAQRDQITGCARRLEQELGEPMTRFSYPVGTPGTFDENTIAAARDAGVRLAFAYAGGVAGPRDFDPLAVPRASVHHAMDDAAFHALITAPRAFARW